MARGVSSPEMIGRGPELAALLDALDRAGGRRFSAVFLGGESGIGKTRLLRELERESESRGARVLARLVPQLGEPDSAADPSATGQPIARACLPGAKQWRVAARPSGVWSVIRDIRG